MRRKLTLRGLKGFLNFNQALRSYDKNKRQVIDLYTF